MSTHESHHANELDARPQHPNDGEPVVIEIIGILVGLLLTPSIPIPPPLR